MIIIKPDVPHRVMVRQGGAEIIYFDGVHLPQRAAAFTGLDASWRGFPCAFEREDHAAVSGLRLFLGGSRPTPDPQVMRSVAQLYAAPFARMGQAELARALGLERTQALRHFKATTGQTFRKFKIWAALVAAARSAHQGERIGIAGVDAGFSDATHTARMAMTTFGLTPTAGLGHLTQMQTLEGG